MKHVINDDEAKAIKKTVKKFSGNDISFTNGTLRGSFKITNFRKYPMHHEVDVEFNGELFAKISVLEGRRWLSSEIYGQKNISKIKVNKLIKKNILSEVRTNAAYFGIEIKWIDNIKKITWI
jgi:hypothetical protein